MSSSIPDVTLVENMKENSEDYADDEIMALFNRNLRVSIQSFATSKNIHSKVLS